MKNLIKGIRLKDVCLTPTTTSKCVPIRWINPLPICTYPSINIINGNRRTSNINSFLQNNIEVMVSMDVPLELRKESVTYFPTQFEINELEEAISSNINISEWRLLIFESPVISDNWVNFLTALYRSGRKFKSVTVGLIPTPEIALKFVNIASDIVVGTDYTDLNKVFDSPIASLLLGIQEAKSKLQYSQTMYFPRVIAFDSELESYEGVIKALILGADTVMLGKMIVKAVECSGEVFKYDEDIGELIRFTEKELPEGIVNTLNSSTLNKYKMYRVINSDTDKYQVEYNLSEMSTCLRRYLNDILSSTGSENINSLRNNININIL